MRHTLEEIAAAIAHGHSFDKHVLDYQEFSGTDVLYGPDIGVRTRAGFEAHILKTMTAPGTKVFESREGCLHFHNDESNTYVFYNEHQPDLGSCYRPLVPHHFEFEWERYGIRPGDRTNHNRVEEGGICALMNKLGRTMPERTADPTPQKNAFELARERALSASAPDGARPRNRDSERER